MRSISRKLLAIGTILVGLGYAQTQALAQTVVALVDFDSDDGGFTVQNTGSVEGPWVYGDVSGTWRADGTENAAAATSSLLTSPTYTVVQSGELSLRFIHAYSFEWDGDIHWDGGQLRLSVNGAPFTAVPREAFELGGYAPGTIGGTGILNGEPAFNGTSPDYSLSPDNGPGQPVESVAILGTFNEGDTLAIQFAGAWDEYAKGAVPNWELDSVEFIPAVENRQFAPVFTDPTLPADAELAQGASHTLEVQVTGVPAPRFLWYKNGLPLFGQTSSSYTIGFATPGVDDGLYSLVANNSEGFATSRVATVTVIPDVEGPLFVGGAVLLDGTVRLGFSEVMSNSFDTFSVFIFEAGGGGAFIGVQTYRFDTNTLTDFFITPSETITPGINYEIFIGIGAVQDQFGNAFSEDDGGSGITRPLATELIVVPIDASWVYDDTVPPLELLTNDPPRFYDVAFDDSSWKTGPAPLGTETDGNLPDGLVINTRVLNTGAGGPTTSYYRHEFLLPGALADIQAVRVRTLIDDGAVLYVNGTEVVRLGVPDGQNSTSYSSRSIGEADWEGYYDIPLNLLVEGENLLAADLHNVNATSSDNVWGAEVVATIGTVVIAAPTIEVEPVSPGTLNEGENLSLTVVAQGTQPLSYQWSLKGSPIADATNSTYSVAGVTTANAGDYVVEITNIGGSISSTPVTVNVIADVVAPVLVSAVASLSPTEVALVFSEPISRATATNTGNYVIQLRDGGGNLAVLNAAYVGSSRSNIVLTTDARATENYRITVRDLTDRSLAANLLSPNPTIVDLPTEVILVDYEVIGAWAYNDSGADQGTAWRLSGFDDSGWASGSPLFYGKRGAPGVLDLPVATTLDLTNAPGVTNAIGSDQTITFYFRGHISLDVDPATVSPLKFQYILDDGAVFYVNEQEALRVGMPSGVITNETLASRTEGNDQFWESPMALETNPFQTGDNLVAVEVHQTSTTSSDIAFAVRLVATIDTITPPLRLTPLPGDDTGRFFIQHNGANVGFDVYIQASTNLVDWVTLPDGPHPSPVDTGPVGLGRFFRATDTP